MYPALRKPKLSITPSSKKATTTTKQRRKAGRVHRRGRERGGQDVRLGSWAPLWHRRWCRDCTQRERERERDGAGSLRRMIGRVTGDGRWVVKA